MAIDRCLFDDAASGNEVIDVGEGGVGLHGMIDNGQRWCRFKDRFYPVTTIEITVLTRLMI